MKKIILILSILFLTVNLFSQEINKEKHYFEYGFTAGFVSNAIASSLTYKVTENKYLSFAVGTIAGIGSGFLVNEYNYRNNKETSQRDIINSAYGVLASNICFNFVINRNKKKKELIDF